MVKKKNKKTSGANDALKYEIAADLGLSEKVAREGWPGLTAAETGRIGGIIRSRKREKGDGAVR